MRFTFAFLVLIQSAAFGQDSLTFEMLVPDAAIKVSPLHLINFYPTIEVSYEQKLLERITAQAELGYVLDYENDNNDQYQNKRGLKTKLEVRYYFWGREDKKKLYYGAVEPYMNFINFDRTRTQRECFDLECEFQFTKVYNFKVENRESGISLKAGMLRYLFRSNFLIDINSGLTLRIVRYHSPRNIMRTPEDEGWGFLIGVNEEDRVVPSPNIGVRFGYRIK